jgi:hypothetical protein
MKIKVLYLLFVFALTSCITSAKTATRTGIPDVDVVLDTVEGGDTRSVRDLFQFTETLCTTADGLGGPPKCRNGEANGTLVSVFPFLGSEGSFLREDEVDNWNGLRETNIYAVFRVSKSMYSDKDYPAGEYGILFLAEENTPGTVLQVTGGKIVRIDTVFSTSEAELSEYLKKNAAEVLLRL